MRQALLPLFLIGALAMAGCGSPAEVQVAPSSTESLAQFGTIAGIVIDEEAVPLADVEVGILAGDATISTVTGSEGAFVLGNVPPGRYAVYATKVGFEATNKPVTVGPGERIEGVQLQLVQFAPPPEPFTETFIDQGFIACAINAAGSTLTVFPFCSVDPNHDPIFEFQVFKERGLVSVVIEVEWQQSTAATGKRMRVELWNDPRCEGAQCDPKVRYGQVNGVSPLRAVYGNASEPIRDGILLGGPTPLAVFVHIAQEPELLAEAVVQQPFKDYVTVFYNSEPTPDYTLRA